MGSRSDDRYTPWRQVIFGVMGVGSFWGGVSMTSAADSASEFIVAAGFFVFAAICFLVCYCLWLLGRHRLKKWRILWGAVTALAVIADLAITLPWVHNKWKEKQPPDLTLCFVSYQHPELIALNPSDKVAEHARLFVGLFDLDATNPNAPLHAWPKTFDLIEPHTATPAYDALEQINDSPPLKTGDRIIGVVSIECPLCAKETFFYAHIVWGKEGGWFSKVKNPQSDPIPALRIPKTNEFTPYILSAPIALAIEKIPDSEQIPIKNLSALVDADDRMNEFKCSSK